MNKRYIIKELISGGYWSSKHHAFKGIIFASLYFTKKDAVRVINTDLSASSYTIIKIYKK